MKRWLLPALLIALLPATVALGQPAVTVAAAADLTFAFKEIGPIFERAHGVKITFIFGSTGNLAKQIEHGSPVDVFFAADVRFPDHLKQRGVTIPESQTLYAQGRIVLATAKQTGLTLTELKDLLRPEVRRIAIAHPGHAPYGRAAREALESVGLWEKLRPKLVYGENIRHAIQFLQTGNAEAGIAALSVANVPEVSYVLIDPALHKPLNQAATVIKRSQRPELGIAFIQFVNGPQGRPIMRRFGFLLPGDF
jgi:molybdate transport system substrate-binding protein